MKCPSSGIEVDVSWGEGAVAGVEGVVGAVGGGGVVCGVGNTVGDGLTGETLVEITDSAVRVGVYGGVIAELGVTSGVDSIVAFGVVVGPGVGVAPGVESGADSGVWPVAGLASVMGSAGLRSTSVEGLDVSHAARIRQTSADRITFIGRIFTMLR